MIGEEAWHERYSGFRGELMALLGLGLQQWLTKGPVTGLAYISSQVSNKKVISYLRLLILRVHAL